MTEQSPSRPPGSPPEGSSPWTGEEPDGLAGATHVDPDEQWRRLDRRMLFVHPVTELIRFLPALVVFFFVGRSGGDEQGRWWHLAAVVAVVALGLLRYLTTTFRITPEQVQLRKGLVSRHILSTRLDRVRTVDLTSSPIHRLLGLSKVVIGTGSSSTNRDDQLSLDALGMQEARGLREELLHRRMRTVPSAGAPERADSGPAGDPGIPAGAPAVDDAHPVDAGDRVLVRLNPAWVRYAPLTTSGVLVAAAALGFLANLLNQMAGRAWQDIGEAVGSWSVPWAVTITVGLLVALVLVSVLAILGYLLTNWGFTVSHNAAGHSYQLRRGLLTTRETSIDDDRIRGLEIGEPLGLRLAGGGRLAVIVTGLDKKSKSSSTLVPPAPAAVIRSVGEDVLGEDGPLTTPLVPHGPAARRRRYTRAFVPAVVVLAVVVAAVVLLDLPWWPVVVGLVPLAVAAPLARDRYAGLGHVLTRDYVVVRSGSFSGRRDAIEREGIIGWTLRASFFQRRAGLVTLTATTAAGRQGYTAYDLDEGVAVALADEAVPGLVTQFLA